MICSAFNINKFPDGTPLIKYTGNCVLNCVVTSCGNGRYDFNYKTFPENLIIWSYECMEELAPVIMIAMAIRERLNIEPILYMPYIPNARMDRIKDKNDVFTLKYFSQMINSVNFKKVFVIDPHSDVAPALINNCVSLMPQDFTDNNMSLVDIMVEDFYPSALYVPDAGALHRYSDLLSCIISKHGSVPILYGVKNRDWKTGKILNLDIVGEVPKNASVLMIDDICSFGGTMQHSAYALKDKGAQNIAMYVTHCEMNILEGDLLKVPNLIRKVYTTNSIFNIDSVEESKKYKFFIFDIIKSGVELLSLKGWLK